MPAILQRFADHATAMGTDLRGVFGIDEHQCPTGPCCLVGTVLDKGCPPCILNALVEPGLGCCPIGQIVAGCLVLFGLRALEEVVRLQVLEDHDLKAIDELARSFVQIVCALMTDLAMSLSQRLDRFVSTMTSTLLVRQGRLPLHFGLIGIAALLQASVVKLAAEGEHPIQVVSGAFVGGDSVFVRFDAHGCCFPVGGETGEGWPIAPVSRRRYLGHQTK